MKSKLFNKILDFDMYGTQPKFKIKKLDYFSTSLGKFLSFLSLLIMFGSAGYFGTSLWDIQNPQLTYSVINHFNPPQVNFTQENFGFAFALEDPITYDHFIDESIYQAEVFENIATRNEDKIFEWESRKLELEQCNIQKFPKSYRGIMAGVNKNMFCLKNMTFSLFGTFLNPSYSYLQIKLTECKNRTNSEIICKPKEVIDSYLLGTFFSFFHTDMTVDPTNYLEPDRKYGGDSYTTISNKFYKEMHHFEKNIDIKTDVGWFIQEISTKKYFSTDFIKEMIDFRIKEEFMSYTFKLSTKVETYGRSYPKIQYVIAQIGGIIQFVYVICEILIYNFNYSKMYELLSNELFHVKDDFENNNKNVFDRNALKSNMHIFRNNLNNPKETDKSSKNNLNINLDFNKTIINSNNNNTYSNNLFPLHSKLNLSNLKDVSNFPIKIHKYSNSNLIKNKLIDKGDKENNLNSLIFNSIVHSYFNLPFCTNFWHLIFPCFFKDRKFIIWKRAAFEIDDRMDIISILKSLYQLKIIQYLLFNKSQMKMLKLPYKTLINCEEENNSEFENNDKIKLGKNNTKLKIKRTNSYLGISVSNKEQVEEKRIKEAYTKVKNGVDSSKINKKLIKILNDGYKSILENNISNLNYN